MAKYTGSSPYLLANRPSRVDLKLLRMCTIIRILPAPRSRGTKVQVGQGRPWSKAFLRSPWDPGPAPGVAVQPPTTLAELDQPRLHLAALGVMLTARVVW
jgi:hypothetical protein